MAHPAEARDTETIFPLSVATLTLTNFRNYEYAPLEVPAEPVVITGPNGAGKTNILEAISFLAPGRGMRGSKLGEIDRRLPASNGNPMATSPWGVNAHVRTTKGEVEIGTGRATQNDSDSRIVKIDGEAQRGHSSLGNVCSVCYLTPQMDTVFIDGSTSRRSFLDRLVIGLNPEHSKHLAIYNNAKSERKRVLYASQDETWLATLEQRMAEQAVIIATARSEALNHLQQAIDSSDTPFPKAQLSVTGTVEQNASAMPALQAEEAFKEQLKASRHADKESGRTNHGPHRSDFVVIHGDKNLPAETCSTGEQKALLLTLTLASVRAKASWSHTVPLLLLDEVFAHLDSEKRAALFAEIAGLKAQSWLTGTDPSFFTDFQGNATFLTVENSNIMR